MTTKSKRVRTKANPEKWTEVRGKTAFDKWVTIQALANGNSMVAKELLKWLIKQDPDHGFVLATNENAATRRPEHFAGPSNEEYEIVILLNALKFQTSRYMGRFQGHQTTEYPTFAQAIDVAGNDPRILVYGICDSGRWVNMTRKYWEFYSALIEVFTDKRFAA